MSRNVILSTFIYKKYIKCQLYLSMQLNSIKVYNLIKMPFQRPLQCVKKLLYHFDFENFEVSAVSNFNLKA